MINAAKEALRGAQGVLDAFAARFALNPSKALETAPYGAAAMRQEMTALIHLAAVEGDRAHLRRAYMYSAEDRLAQTPPSMHDWVEIAQAHAIELLETK